MKRRVYAAILVTLAACSAWSEPAPLNSSVLIFDQRTLAQAPETVERAAALGNRRLMFVVTVQVRLTPELRVRELGYMVDRRSDWGEPENFLPITDERRRQFTDQLTTAFTKAVELGLDIAILPHYDPAGEVFEWRNLYDFEPYEKHNGHSYATAVIDPIVEALRRSAKPQTRVQFALSGEMGRSLFTHPAAYRRLAAQVRDGLQGHDLQVGLGLNFSGNTGEQTPTAEQCREMQRLVDACDFVGFSNYSPFEPPPNAAQFSRDCQALLDELAALSIVVPEGTPLLFSEIAIGGKDSVVASAAEPWEGSPRASRNPWRTEEMISLRRAYYTELLHFLKTQPGSRPVTAAYLWSEGSWDPQGLDRQEFLDPVIVEMIREHNRSIADDE